MQPVNIPSRQNFIARKLVGLFHDKFSTRLQLIMNTRHKVFGCWQFFWKRAFWVMIWAFNDWSWCLVFCFTRTCSYICLWFTQSSFSWTVSAPPHQIGVHEGWRTIRINRYVIDSSHSFIPASRIARQHTGVLPMSIRQSNSMLSSVPIRHGRDATEREETFQIR